MEWPEFKNYLVMQHSYFMDLQKHKKVEMLFLKNENPILVIMDGHLDRLLSFNKVIF